MEAPALIRMLGSDIQVKFQESLSVDGSAAMGTYEQEQSTIILKDNMSLSSIRDTLVHELIHAILQHYEMDSEKIVRVMTPALVTLLRDNPDLVRFITEGTGYQSGQQLEPLHQQGHWSSGNP